MRVIVILRGASAAVPALFCVLSRNDMRGGGGRPSPPPSPVPALRCRWPLLWSRDASPALSLQGAPPGQQITLVSAAAPLRAKEQMVAPWAA